MKKNLRFMINIFAGLLFKIYLQANEISNMQYRSSPRVICISA
jgi:hypothetical protein